MQYIKPGDHWLGCCNMTTKWAITGQPWILFLNVMRLGLSCHVDGVETPILWYYIASKVKASPLLLRIYMQVSVCKCKENTLLNESN